MNPLLRNEFVLGQCRNAVYIENTVDHTVSKVKIDTDGTRYNVDNRYSVGFIGCFRNTPAGQDSFRHFRKVYFPNTKLRKIYRKIGKSEDKQGQYITHGWSFSGTATHFDVYKVKPRKVYSY